MKTPKSTPKSPEGDLKSGAAEIFFGMVEFRFHRK